MKKCSRQEPSFAPLNEEDAPQNQNHTPQFFMNWYFKIQKKNCNKKAKLRDLWEQKDLGKFNEKYAVYLGSHDSQLLKVFPIEDATILEENEHEIQNYVMIALGGR